MRFLFWGKKSPEQELKELESEMKRQFLEHQEKRSQLENEKRRHPERAAEIDKLIRELDAHYRARFDDANARLEIASQKVSEKRSAKN